MDSETRLQLKGHGYILLGTVFIASSFISANVVKEVANPVSLMLLRFLMALGFFWLMAAKEERLWRRVWKILPSCFVTGFFYTNYFLVQFYALRYTDVVHMSAVSTLVPLATSIAMLILFKERLLFSRTMVYLVAMLGVFIVIFDGSLERILGFRLNKGDVLFFLGVISMALYGVSLKKFSGTEKTAVYSIGIAIASSVMLFAFIMVTGMGFGWDELNARHWGNLLWLTFGATVMTMILLQKSVAIIGPTAVMSYSFLNPVFTLIMALMLVPGTSINAMMVFGIFLTFIATFLLQMRRFSS